MVHQVVNYLEELGDDELRELFEERAAILEFDSGLPRSRAERLAFFEVVEKHGCFVKEHAVARR